MTQTTKTPLFKPELLAPAGSFAHAVYAFESGADAVYVGLNKFSARSSATNFSLDELRRLKQFARQQNKKIFVAINTIVTTAELHELLITLGELSLIEIDAIIVQDIGVLALIAKNFQNLTLHASTQMAVHNSAGVLALKNLGVRRIVLARELSLHEITKIRAEHRDIEFEVFCHGALCYSVSGICLASGLMLDRSANRGRCAQICRSYFAEDHSAEQGYFFSMNDLHLAHKVHDLAAIGVDSLKIEGRMKSISYVRKVTSYYRYLLDHTDSRSEGNLAKKLEQEATLTFSRLPTDGYFTEKKGKNLLNPLYASHMGLYVGEVVEAHTRVIKVKTSLKLSPSDQLIFMGQSLMTTPKNGFIMRTSPALPGFSSFELGQGCDHPQKGDKIYLIKRGGKEDPSTVDLNRYERSYKNLPLKITLGPESIEISSTLKEEPLTYRLDNTLIDEAQKNISLVETLQKSLVQKGESRFSLQPKIELVNASGKQAPFLPPSQLKKLNRGFFARADELFLCRNQESAAAILESIPAAVIAPLTPFSAAWQERRNLNPKHPVHGQALPFLCEHGPLSLENLAYLDGFYVIPLIPILKGGTSAYGKRIFDLIKSYPQKKFILGINNISHVSLVQKNLPLENCFYFLDFLCYTANPASFLTWREIIGQSRLLFSYQFTEKDPSEEHDAVPELPFAIRIKTKEDLPYFISLACYHRFNHAAGNCPTQCPQNYNYGLANQKNKFKIIIADCVTYMFAVPR